MSFVEFHDDAVEFDKAKNYLLTKCAGDEVSADDTLFEGLDKDKTYRATELDKIYGDWYSEFLRYKLYPEYAHFEKAGSQILKELVKSMCVCITQA